MKQFSVMIKPASALCNLRCRYCFYANISELREVRSFGVMSAETTDRMLENIRKDLVPGDRITFAFQGGEPTVAGLDYFRHFTDLTAQWPSGIRVSFALQTNGTLLNEDWAAFLAEHHFLVGLSLDLQQEIHDSDRVDAAGKGSWKKVVSALRLLRKHHVEVNVLCTLTNRLARHALKVWNTIEKLDLNYVQFTPCLDELDAPGESVYALTPERFAAFYKEIFPRWYESYRRGNYRSIKFFDDVVNLMAYGVPSACGFNGHCQPQLVVESDGSTYPCDFYCLDAYRLGNFTEQTILELWKRSVESPQKKPQRLPEFCGSCPYRKFCGGGCIRMRREICLKEGDTFCGYRSFLDAAGNTLAAIAEEERNYRR